MAFRIPGIIVFVTCGVLFTGAATGQARIGDWDFRIDREGAAIKGRVAYTSAHPGSGGQAGPRLVIRRMKSDGPVELLVTDTHDTERDNCAYKDWNIAIDATDIPVLGYTFAPAKTELKAHWGTSPDELWDLFRKGLKLTVRVEQKCDSMSGASNPVSHGFSLRGSSAAYQFVMADIE